MFGIGFLWFTWARLREHQERFLDYRALAESLRVAVFWKLVGVAGPKTETGLHSIADAYPIKQTSELAWVKLCLRTLELLDQPQSPTAGERELDPAAYGWARNLWVGGQLDFFFRRGRDHNETAERRERISFVLVALSIGTAFLLFWSNHYHWPFPAHDAWYYRWIVFFMGAMPGCAAAIVGYTEQLALKAQARQYDRMRMLFERAYQLLPDTLGQDLAGPGQGALRRTRLRGDERECRMGGHLSPAPDPAAVRMKGFAMWAPEMARWRRSCPGRNVPPSPAFARPGGRCRRWN